MKNAKLKINIYDIAVNVICLLQLAGIVIYLIVIWNDLPDKIPGHYNAAGVIDRWGNKGELLILPIVSWIMYLGISAIERFPQIWNTGVQVTEENKTHVYRILKNMIGTTKLVMVSAFVFIALNSARAQALPVWFLPVVVCLTFASIIFFIVKLIRAR